MEVFLARWLLERFGMPGAVGFRDARVAYCLYGFPERVAFPEDVLVLEPECLSSWCQFRELYLQIPQGINNIFNRYIEEMLADKSLDWHIVNYWLSHVDGCICQLTKILFSFFQERLDEAIYLEEIEGSCSAC